MLLPLLPTRCRRRIHRTLVRQAAVKNSLASHTDSKDGFRIEPVEGKGLGAIAERSFACGELVLAETPAFRYKSKDTATIRQQRFDALPFHEQDAVMALHDNFAAEEDGKTLDGILRTNTETCDNSDFDMMICPIISRFNHSCKPNCELSWDDTLKEEHVYAATAIKPGEELCMHWVNIIAPATDRQRELTLRFGFQCVCSFCSQGPNISSDERRSRLQELWQDLEMEGPDEPEYGLEMIGDMLRLYAAEEIHLQSLKCQACNAASQLLMMLEDVESATKWANEAHKFSIRCRGRNHADTRALAADIKQLEKVPKD
mmetsp:Transcript_1772/g.3343  ORF Transcript_1772/g.3343 Transcript_1772/m.3343 type:complete len:316 (+) Transcript_1772:213-1160(+)